MCYQKPIKRKRFKCTYLHKNVQSQHQPHCYHRRRKERDRDWESVAKKWQNYSELWYNSPGEIKLSNNNKISISILFGIYFTPARLVSRLLLHSLPHIAVWDSSYILVHNKPIISIWIPRVKYATVALGYWHLTGIYGFPPICQLCWWRFWSRRLTTVGVVLVGGAAAK